MKRWTAISDIAALEALYGEPNPRSLEKVADRITPLYREWIEASRFVVLSTVGPEGTDASPRGDDGPVVRVADEGTLLLPDWRGNDRIDSLRNIVRDGRVSLMFLVPGSQNVVRVNGRGSVTVDEGLCASFEKGGRRPRTVVAVAVGEVYFQCAKAIMRSGLWEGGDVKVPSAGDFLREATEGFDGAGYDAGYPAYARKRMW